MGTTSVPNCVHFRLVHGYLFSDWISFDLQLLQPALSESELTLARFAAESQLIHSATLKQLLTPTYPHQRFVALEAFSRTRVQFQIHRTSASQV
jgi:hypothetical protein